MKLEMSILAGPESKQFLADLTLLVERMEKLAQLKEIAMPKMTIISHQGTSTRFAEAGAKKPDAGYEGVEAKPTGPVTIRGKKVMEATFEGVLDDEDSSLDASDDIQYKSLADQMTGTLDDFDAEETPAPKKQIASKKAPPKTFTQDDVNDACKARVKTEISVRGMPGPEARKTVLGLLKKKFGVTSVAALDPKKFGDVIKVMQAG